MAKKLPKLPELLERKMMMLSFKTELAEITLFLFHSINGLEMKI